MKDEKTETKRVIGTYCGKENGPLLLITAGVHGNEPSGVKALQRVFAELQKTKPVLKGTILGLAGNVAALNKNVRFIDEDLNRVWTKSKLSKTGNLTQEEKEMNDIISVFETYNTKDYPQRYFMDCHSTSAESLPYISVQDVGGNNAWAHKFPVFIVKGFSDIVDGSIDKYFSGQGMTGFTFEAGQHTDANTSKHHEALIWHALEKANKLDLSQIACNPDCVDVFEKNDAIVRKTFEIIYRHGLSENDDFTMNPGFDNFQKIESGQVLAEQNGQEILSEWNARIFMPLYQAQGNDGFFVVKEVGF